MLAAFIDPCYVSAVSSDCATSTATTLPDTTCTAMISLPLCIELACGQGEGGRETRDMGERERDKDA